MRVFGMHGGEYVFAFLPILLFYLVILAVAAVVLYFVIRKAVCAGMEDFEKKKTGRQQP